jgi:hypothetical protein
MSSLDAPLLEFLHLTLDMAPQTRLDWDWLSAPKPAEAPLLGADGKRKTIYRARTPPPDPFSDQLSERMNDVGRRTLLDAFASTAPSLRYVFLNGWGGTNWYWEITRASATTVEFREMEWQEGLQIWERYDRADA